MAMAKNRYAKYSEILDFIIKILYAVRNSDKVNFFSLTKIINRLQYPASPFVIQDTGKYLKAKGYVNATFGYGDVGVRISPYGIMYFEENEDRINASYKNYYRTLKTENLIEDDYIQKRQPIFDLLKKIKSETKDEELKHDCESLITELNKYNPDINILTIKIDSLQAKQEALKYIEDLKAYLNI